jgi:transglutaminase-like putative cysteine protease
MKLRIHRSEQIAFDGPVREHHLEWRCAPWDDAGQRLHRLELSCQPVAALASHRDCFGNQVHRTALLGAHDGLTLHMEAEVETQLDDPFDFKPVPLEREREWLRNALREAPRLWDLVLARNAASPLLDALMNGDSAADLGVHAAVADGLPVPGAGTALFASLQAANSWIGATCATTDPADMDADDGAEAAARGPSADTPLRSAAGSTTELALLMLAVARGWGLPARLVSGYRHAATGSGHSTAHAGLHYWAEVLVPGAGWRGFDPALGRLADGAYVRLAVGRDAGDLQGLRQSWKGEGGLGEARTEILVESLG